MTDEERVLLQENERIGEAVRKRRLILAITIAVCVAAGLKFFYWDKLPGNVKYTVYFTTEYITGANQWKAIMSSGVDVYDIPPCTLMVNIGHKEEEYYFYYDNSFEEIDYSSKRKHSFKLNGKLKVVRGGNSGYMAVNAIGPERDGNGIGLYKEGVLEVLEAEGFPTCRITQKDLDSKEYDWRQLPQVRALYR